MQELIVAIAAVVRALYMPSVALVPNTAPAVRMSHTGSDTDVAAGSLEAALSAAIED